MRKFHLEISNPNVVAQTDPSHRKWGQFQFPKILKTESGGFYAYWDHGLDDYDYDFLVMDAVSDDGKTWRKKTANDVVKYPKMKNGNYFIGFKRAGTHTTDYLANYSPVVTNKKGQNYYFAGDIKEDADKKVYGIELDAQTGKERVFECKINWNNMPIHSMGEDKIFPLTTVFYLTSEAIVEIDGVLFAPLYTCGFDSDAKDKKDAIPKYLTNGVYIFSSIDGGQSWDYKSQVLVDDSTFNEDSGFEGFDEPHIAKMPDGSIVLLMRTGAGLPSYIARSTDGARTWSAPKKFDDIGVLPQIKTLDCGVTLSSYGRPILKVRATSDPSGLVWEEPIQIPMSNNVVESRWNGNCSCFYTNLAPVSDTEALLIYSDFNYPNPEGIPTKTILTRKISVVFDD